MLYGMLINLPSHSCFLSFVHPTEQYMQCTCLNYLFLKMICLPAEAQERFNHGNFVAKLTPGSFNSVLMDYVLEAMENKALKSSGGIIGLTNQDNALT